MQIHCATEICISFLKKTFSNKLFKIVKHLPFHRKKLDESLLLSRKNEFMIFHSAHYDSSVNWRKRYLSILVSITSCLFAREFASQCVFLVGRVKDICIYIKLEPNLNDDNLFLLVCPEKPNVLAIVLGVLGGLVVVGIIVVLIVKFGIDYRDYRNLQAFLEEVKNAKWSTVCIV